MNVKAVFTRFEILYVGHDLHFIANFCECDQTRHLTSGLWLQLRDRFCDALWLGKTNPRAKHRYEENSFHVANVPRFSAK